MPLRQGEMDRIGKFFGDLLNGEADLGMGALSMLALYKEAKAQKVNFLDLVLTDPDMADRIVKALSKRAADLPDNVIRSLKLVIDANTEGKVKRAAEKSQGATQAAHFRTHPPADDDV